MKNLMRTLSAKDIKKRFKKREAVKGISIEIMQGEIVGLLGPNGAGKTTTFQMITGDVKADSGHIFFDETDITNYLMYKRANKRTARRSYDGIRNGGKK